MKTRDCEAGNTCCPLFQRDRSDQSPEKCKVCPRLPFKPSQQLCNPARLCSHYLQSVVYGASVGDQLIEGGGVEMLLESYQPHQLVCRNLEGKQQPLSNG